MFVFCGCTFVSTLHCKIRIFLYVIHVHTKLGNFSPKCLVIQRHRIVSLTGTQKDIGQN
jgi:hypothetical protein